MQQIGSLRKSPAEPLVDPRRSASLMAMREEASYICDACGEEIVVPIDVSAGSSQEYVEDCPVCCRPNVVHVEIDEDGGAQVWAEPEAN
jgi:hypothetical protein